MTKRSSSLIVLVLTVALVACNTWPTIILTAQSIALLTDTVDPGLSSLSTLAVHLLSDAEAAVTQYKQTKATTDLAKAQAAIQAIQTELPAALAQLKVSTEVQQRAEAAVSIIVDYVEGLGIEQPALAPAIMAQRAKRTTTPAPRKPLTKKDIEARWTNEACRGDKKCGDLIRGPGFWRNLGTAVGQAKFGGD